MREKWLNGWRRNGTKQVMMGTATHCAGCGQFRGTFAAVIPEGHMFPENDPDWPFEKETCPVCQDVKW